MSTPSLLALPAPSAATFNIDINHLYLQKGLLNDEFSLPRSAQAEAALLGQQRRDWQ